MIESARKEPPQIPYCFVTKVVVFCSFYVNMKMVIINLNNNFVQALVNSTHVLGRVLVLTIAKNNHCGVSIHPE